MKTFKIPVSWEMCGFVKVKAATLAEAITRAVELEDTFELPKDGNYIDASFKIETDESYVSCFNTKDGDR
jgi:hypothetical protein